MWQIEIGRNIMRTFSRHMYINIRAVEFFAVTLSKTLKLYYLKSDVLTNRAAFIVRRGSRS